MSRAKSLILATALWSALCACAATQSTDVELSGFLADYAQLQPGRGDQALLVYIDRDTDFSGYDKVLVEPAPPHQKGRAAHRAVRCPRAESKRRCRR